MFPTLQIINLVSNDVRRLDDAGTFWNFLLCGPLELMVVLVLVGLRLGFPAAVAGVAALLALIPVQVRTVCAHLYRRVQGGRECQGHVGGWVLCGWRLRHRAADMPSLLLLMRCALLQGGLARYIGQLRSNTAAQTDERVRLTSEAIEGVLAAKMMSECLAVTG